MKIQWNDPVLKKLELEDTKKVNPIIIYREEATFSANVKPDKKWRCPCCQQEAGQWWPYNDDMSLEENFDVHLNGACPNYDKENDRCIS